ncbi:MAG: hypothetical protein ACR2J8_01810, partial [Thermomicrobiales bacterium]
FGPLPERLLGRLDAARSLRVRSTSGTDLSVDLGDPALYPRSFIGRAPRAAGEIGAPLCRSVTAPFVHGAARGVVVFDGVGRIQGPHPTVLTGDAGVVLTIVDGMLTDVTGASAAADALREWIDAAPTNDVRTVMDCNIGCDPRLDPAWGDNSTIHSVLGGFMVGIGNPYEWRPDGSHRPGHHLDLLLPGVDVDLDDEPLLRGGTFV